MLLLYKVSWCGWSLSKICTAANKPFDYVSMCIVTTYSSRVVQAHWFAVDTSDAHCSENIKLSEFQSAARKPRLFIPTLFFNEMVWAAECPVCTYGDIHRHLRTILYGDPEKKLGAISASNEGDVFDHIKLLLLLSCK